MKPEPTIYLAEFEEYYGEIKKAIEILEYLLENQGKGHLESVVSLSNIYKRNNDIKGCLGVFEKYKNDFKKEHLPYIIILQTSYLPYEDAKNLFNENIKTFQYSKIFWLSYLELEIKNSSDNIDKLFKLVTDESNLSFDDKIEIYNRLLDFYQKTSIKKYNLF
jgi:hypothetical protein